MLLKINSLYCASGLVWLLFSTQLIANEKSFTTELLSLNLAQLMNVEVVTASRKSQRLAHTPAAAFVITREDIRRSGAASLPEALRLAPGVEVGEISPDKWSVTIRGFGGRFAGKLLVLIDGRSIYTPSFSGVYWEMHAPLLDDIDRIEVIRGPGATLWGSNAVNGVINIITRHSNETLNGVVNLAVGNQKQGGSVRWGSNLSDNASYRVYAKAEHQNAFDAVDNNIGLDNGFERYQMGMRADWQASDADQFMFSAEVLQMNQGHTANLPDMNASTLSRLSHSTTHINNGHGLGRWERTLSEKSDFKLQVSLDGYERQGVDYGDTRLNANIDFQHHLRLGQRHDVVWGAAYRYSQSDIDESAIVAVSHVPDITTFGAFVQDEIELISERLWLTAGVKVEESEFSDWEWQPNVRLLWTLNEKHSFWGSVARAVRLPSLADRSVDKYDFAGLFLSVPTSPVPLPVLGRGSSNPDFESEVVLAYELGYRSQINERLSFDLALYYHDYQQLRDFGIQGFEPEAHYFVTVVRFSNTIEGSIQGLEWALDWQPSPTLRWRLAYHLMAADFESTSSPEQIALPSIATVYEQSSPKQQLSLYSQWQINPRFNASFWLRAVDEAPLLGGALGSLIQGVDEYVTFDLRLAWSPKPNLELALLGKNLLDTAHQEAVDDTHSVPGEVPRSIMGTVRWEFGGH